jgi:hypothetical protein
MDQIGQGSFGVGLSPVRRLTPAPDSHLSSSGAWEEVEGPPGSSMRRGSSCLGPERSSSEPPAPAHLLLEVLVEALSLREREAQLVRV